MAQDLLQSLTDPRFPPEIYGPTPPDLDGLRPLRGTHRADVCVVGGGYTGLSAALHLARAGRRVILLEAHRIGHGASGRNGGQLLAGQRLHQEALERLVGVEDARKLWDMGHEAMALVRRLIAESGTDCDLRDGALSLAYRPREVAGLHRSAEYLVARYGHRGVELLDASTVQDYLATDCFAGGFLDRSSGHLNPLAYARALAGLARSAGADLHEQSPVRAVENGRITLAQGDVRADHVVLACNGYLGGLEPEIARHVMPINNFVLVTEPLPAGAAFRRPVCASDDHFVVNYFRPTPDNRLIFGGGESYGYTMPGDIAAKLRPVLARIFPNLKDTRIDAAWGGTLAITMSRMPHFTAPAPGLWSASGFSGHGIATATHAGAMISHAIQGDRDAFDIMARVPTQRFPGGTTLRWPLLVAAMTWYGLRDRLGI